MIGKNLTSRVQGEAYQLVFLQSGGVILLALAVLVFAGIKAGTGVLLGGLAYVLPNIIFVWRVFRYSSAQQMNLFVAAFFIGEMLKLFFSAILFLMIVKYCPVSLLSVLAGFVGAIVFFWVACFWHFCRKS